MPDSHVIQYLDNDFSVQIPEEFLEEIGVRKGDGVELICQDGAITLVKADGPDSDTVL